MLAQAIDTHPLVASAIVGVLGILVAVGIVRGLLALFIDWADGPDPDVQAGASEAGLRRDWPPPIKVPTRPLAQKLLTPRQLRIVDREVRR